LGVSKAIPRAIQEPKKKPTVLLFSAARPEAAKKMAETHQVYLSKYPERLSDVAYTLAERRERLKYRAFCITDGAEQLTESNAAACQDIEQACFVFTGQGAQW
jgi:acyl transferase domain-containing protein